MIVSDILALLVIASDITPESFQVSFDLVIVGDIL